MSRRSGSGATGAARVCFRSRNRRRDGADGRIGLAIGTLLALGGTARAGVTSLPSANTFGAVLYEDQWPCAGDDDFNDVVLRYNTRAFGPANGSTTHLSITVDVEALGARKCSGAALRLPVPPSDVASATLRPGTPGSVTGAPFGAAVPLSGSDLTDAGGDTVVWIADNLRSSLCGGSTGFVNTVSGTPVNPCTPVVLDVDLTNPVTLPSGPPWDLFIYRCADRTHQIHLSQYDGLPQGSAHAADLSLFGTCDDASDGPTGSTWYVQSRPIPGLPFALDIGESIGGDGLTGYPLEQRRIDQALPDIVPFAAGNGHTDYYKTNTVTAALFTDPGPTLSLAPESAFDDDQDGYCVGFDTDADPGTPDACLFGTSTGDCDDLDGTVYPNAPELCDGIDNNCNRYIDEGILGTSGCPAPTCADVIDVNGVPQDGIFDVQAPDGSGPATLRCLNSYAGGNWYGCAHVDYTASSSTVSYDGYGNAISSDSGGSYLGAGGTAAIKNACLGWFGESALGLTSSIAGSGNATHYAYFFSLPSDLSPSTSYYLRNPGQGMTCVSGTAVDAPPLYVHNSTYELFLLGDGTTNDNCLKNGANSGTSQGLWLVTQGYDDEMWLELSDGTFDRLGSWVGGGGVRQDGTLDLWVR